MKKIIRFSLFVFLFLFGLYDVFAVDYNPHDKISVSVNASEKLDFYVIKDNGDNVTAVYSGVIDGGKWINSGSDCNYQNTIVAETLHQETMNWNNVSSVTLPSINNIVVEDFDYMSVEEFNTLKNSNQSLDTNTFYINNSSINNLYVQNDSATVELYTNSVVNYDNVCYIYTYSFTPNGRDLLRIVDANDSVGYSIKPIITVSKEFIEEKVQNQNESNNQYNNDNNSEIDIEYLNNFIDEYKKSALVKYLEAEGAEIDVNYVSDNLVISYKKDDLDFNYSLSYMDNVLSFGRGNGFIIDDSAKLYSIFIDNIISVLCDIKGYDENDLRKWLMNHEQLDFEKDGITFTVEEVSLPNGEKELVYSSFAINIKDGIKTYKPLENSEEITEGSSDVEENVVNVDSTLSTVSFICVIISIITILVGLCIYFYNYCKMNSENKIK